ncbi:type II secretion system F family protein [Candidatus Poribacteria bacterium]|nr:type II secretion system F family protein [Candidatus Poribacteria bacterium]
MPVFNYEALTTTGDVTAGTMEAASKPELVVKLRSMGYYPKSIDQVGKKKEKGFEFSLGRGRVRAKDVEFFSYQVSTLLNAAVSLPRALTITMGQVSSEGMRRVVEQVRSEVEQGASLADALSQHPRVFNELYVNMVKAGEEGGVINVVMERLADFAERQRTLKETVISALFYPAILILIAIGAVTILTFFVIPKFTVLYTDLNITLPLPTRVLLGGIGFVTSYWWAVVIASLVVFFGLRQYASSEEGKIFLDKLKLRLPIFGDVFQKFALSRFTRTLGTLQSNSVPLLQSLRVCKETIGNRIYRGAVESGEQAIARGASLSSTLEESGVFPELVTQLISIGEESAQLEQMFEKLAEYYDLEIKKSLERLTSILSPIIILIMGVLVGFIAVAMILPIFQASTMIGGG